MFDYYRYIANGSSVRHRRTDPQCVSIWVYDDGRVRVQRRCAVPSPQYYYAYYRAGYLPSFRRGRPVYRIDRWYSCLEDVYPLLTAMTQSNRYVLDPVRQELPGALFTHEERALHALVLADRRTNSVTRVPIAVSDEAPVF